tara:strand:+ start:740 stop:1219 length:480 start_codon:yes stop_codon:yes gene_type:complete
MAFSYQTSISPAKWLEAKERARAVNNEGKSTITPFTKGMFPTAKKKHVENTKKDLETSFSDISSKEGQTALYGDQFDSLGDNVKMLSGIKKADTELAIAEEGKKYQEALEAKQRAACKRSKSKGLIGSIGTFAIGAATANPALMIQGGVSAAGNLGSSC